ncbi:MAG: hypothetical protein KC445_04635 [Anaerolineales bacterium]|nr:hypothetical protein [Anaerolineales bacterium]
MFKIGEFSKIAQVLPVQVGSDVLGHFTAVIQSDTLEDDQVDVEMGYQLQKSTHVSITLPSKRQMQMRILPGTETMATVIRKGGFENNHESYRPPTSLIS